MSLEEWSFIATIISGVAPVIALFISGYTLKQVITIKNNVNIVSIEKDTKKQEANNNKSSQINMNQ